MDNMIQRRKKIVSLFALDLSLQACFTLKCLGANLDSGIVPLPFLWMNLFKLRPEIFHWYTWSVLQSLLAQCLKRKIEICDLIVKISFAPLSLRQQIFQHG